MNSHTHLPIVVDPSETLLMSGLFIFSCVCVNKCLCFLPFSARGCSLKLMQ